MVVSLDLTVIKVPLDIFHVCKDARSPGREPLIWICKIESVVDVILLTETKTEETKEVEGSFEDREIRVWT